MISFEVHQVYYDRYCHNCNNDNCQGSKEENFDCVWGQTGEVPCQQVAKVEGVNGTFVGVAPDIVWFQQLGQGLQSTVAVLLWFKDSFTSTA